MTGPLVPGVIIEGELLPEPLRVVFVQPVGAQTKVGGQGLRSGRYFERVLTAEQVGALRDGEPGVSMPCEGTDRDPVVIGGTHRAP